MNFVCVLPLCLCACAQCVIFLAGAGRFLTRLHGAHAQTCCHDLLAFSRRRGQAKLTPLIMKALRGMVSGAVNEITSAVSGHKPAAAREHVLAVSRDYISQPRLSEQPFYSEKKPAACCFFLQLARCSKPRPYLKMRY